MSKSSSLKFIQLPSQSIYRKIYIYTSPLTHAGLCISFSLSLIDEGVQFTLAQAQVEIEAARLLVYNAARMQMEGLVRAREREREIERERRERERKQCS